MLEISIDEKQKQQKRSTKFFFFSFYKFCPVKHIKCMKKNNCEKIIFYLYLYEHRNKCELCI